ncbi:MAG: hypothetical protein ABI868_07210 [Acidobacteriota bacterium]
MPGVLDDASRFNGTFKPAGVGETVKLAVGDPAGGRITPGGTRRIVAVAPLRADACALEPFGDATMSISVPVPPLAGGGGPGAVYLALAVPS